jgi:hypothetical protein
MNFILLKNKPKKVVSDDRPYAESEMENEALEAILMGEFQGSLTRLIS